MKRGGKTVLPVALNSKDLLSMMGNRMQLHTLLGLTLSVLLCGAGQASVAANGYQAGTLVVNSAYARTTVPHQPTAAAYLNIENQGKSSDKLLSFSSPIAKEVEIHTMSMQGDMMQMRPINDLVLQPARKLAMHPGNGPHLMLIGLKKQLKKGDQFPMTLNFEKAGKLDIIVNVEEIKAK